MPDENLTRSLTGHLFYEPDATVYAVLDGAAVPELLDRLYGDERPEFECLFRGSLEPDMAEVAPYLVQLEPDADFTRWVLGNGWGNHWGIFAAAPATLGVMRVHFRSLTMVKGPEGRLTYFRFYDPRVLRRYLPTCTPEEREQVFGPVLFYAFEDADPAVMLRAWAAGEQARTEQLPVRVAEKH